MSRIIAVFNQAGGVAKTWATTSAQLGQGETFLLDSFLGKNVALKVIQKYIGRQLERIRIKVVCNTHVKKRLILPITLLERKFLLHIGTESAQKPGNGCSLGS